MWTRKFLFFPTKCSHWKIISSQLEMSNLCRNLPTKPTRLVRGLMNQTHSYLALSPFEKKTVTLVFRFSDKKRNSCWTVWTEWKTWEERNVAKQICVANNSILLHGSLGTGKSCARYNMAMSTWERFLSSHAVTLHLRME